MRSGGVNEADDGDGSIPAQGVAGDWPYYRPRYGFLGLCAHAYV
jgi:hypothetical protein